MPDGGIVLEIIDDSAGPTADKSKVSIADDGMVTIQYGGAGEDNDEDDRDEGPDDNFDRNLALGMDDSALSSLAAFLIEGIDADLEGRSQWEDTANRAADYLGIQLNNPDVKFDGTVSDQISTVMLEAAIKLWGTSRTELLPTAGPVKVERIQVPDPDVEPARGMGDNGGPPLDEEQAQADARADRLADALERDMNWYLTTGDRGYGPDTSKMLMHRNLIGCAFKEVFRCPIERKPLSRWVMAQDLIVSGDPSHLSAAARVTKRARIRQSTMKRMQVSGYYMNIPLVAPTGEASTTELVIGQVEGVSPIPALPRDNEHVIYECHTDLGSGTGADLFGDLAVLDRDETGRKPGYPMPYTVAMDKDSRTVLSIRRNWRNGDRDHRVRDRFVKFGFVPGFGFYDWGLIHMVGNPTQAATMLQRSIIDGGMFANFPAWAIRQSAASRMDTTTFRPGPGDIVKIPVTGMSKLQDDMMPWPYKEPSQASIGTQAKLESDVRKLAGIVEIPVGEGRVGNTPVGTIMSYIESTAQVPGAVHKDDHIAQQHEFELLRELLAEEPEVLYRGNKRPARRWQLKEELLSPNLVPRADPNTPSQIHRLMKVQGLIMLSGLPQFAQGDKDGPIVNQRAIFRRAAEVLSGSDAAEYTLKKQPPTSAPPPDPKVLAAQIKDGTTKAQIAGRIQEKQIDHAGDMAELQLEGQQREADRIAADQRAKTQLEAARVKAAYQAHNSHTDRVHQAGIAAAQAAHEADQNAQDRAQDHAQHLNEVEMQKQEMAANLQAAALKPEASGDK